jgi:NADH-quinone oxidoreductase subunit L
VCAITAFMAAFIALTQRDIKRVLAYSTISQLGYMMLALGVGAYSAGLFHLMTHAFFKALLFLCSGSVIHAAGTQDLFEMGGLKRKMPITACAMTIGAMAISGIPFLSGFYSKDAILAGTLGFALENPGHSFLAISAFVTAGLTAFYMFRLIFLTFSGAPRKQKVFDHAHESPWSMTIPLMILAVLAISSGWGGLSGGWFEHAVPMPQLADYVSHAPVHHAAAHQGAHHGGAHFLAMILSIALAFSGIFIATLGYWDRAKKRFGGFSPQAISQRFRTLYALSLNKLYIDEFYQKVIIRPLLRVTEFLAYRFDLGVIDRAVDQIGTGTTQASHGTSCFDDRIVDRAVDLTGSTVLSGGQALQAVQTGRVQNYFTVILIAIVLVLALYFAF